MRQTNEFVEYLLELLQGIGEVKVRAMFGGYGIYHDDIMFALVADEILYFKTDDNNIQDFEERGLEPFQYERSGKQISMSYSEAPGEVLDDPDEMTLWARKAIDVARRNALRKHPNKK
jgi:DNA transformation protein